MKIVNSSKLEFISHFIWKNLSAIAIASTWERWRLLLSLGIVIVKVFFFPLQKSRAKVYVNPEDNFLCTLMKSPVVALERSCKVGKLSSVEAKNGTEANFHTKTSIIFFFSTRRQKHDDELENILCTFFFDESSSSLESREISRFQFLMLSNWKVDLNFIQNEQLFLLIRGKSVFSGNVLHWKVEIGFFGWCQLRSLNLSDGISEFRMKKNHHQLTPAFTKTDLIGLSKLYLIHILFAIIYLRLTSNR